MLSSKMAEMTVSTNSSSLNSYNWIITGYSPYIVISSEDIFSKMGKSSKPNKEKEENDDKNDRDDT